MRKLIIIALLLLSTPCIAADFYIAQVANPTGDAQGGDCDNSHAIAGLSWGAGNDIEAGDTLHLCGTFTSTLTIGDSGSSGSPYTIYFEEDAKFSKANWGSYSSSAIYGSNKSYIIIDGGTNGIIENTDTGTAGSYGSQGLTTGVCFENASTNNIEVKNLTIRNL